MKTLSNLASDIASDKNKQVELLKTAASRITDLEHKIECHDYVFNQIELGKVATTDDVLNLFNEIVNCDNIEIYKTARDMSLDYESGISDSDFNMDYYFNDKSSDRVTKEDAINQIREINK